MAYVYKHVRLDDNSVFYIGIGSDTDYGRAYCKSGRNKYWQRIVRKHGYKIEIIEDGISRKIAIEREKYWIKHYGRKLLGEGTLVNMTEGGDGVGNPSSDLRKLWSSQHKGEKNGMWGKTHSAEVIEKLKLRTGKNNPFFGKKHTEEHKLRMKYNNPSQKQVDDELIKKLNSEGSSVTEIHKRTGITRRIIHNRLKRYGLPHNAPVRYLRKKC